MPTTWFTYDFGYTWPLTLGHVLVCLSATALALFGYWIGWRNWVLAALTSVAVWGCVGALVVHNAIQLNEPQRVVTDAFLPSGDGRVLDLGAGSGRATVGLLLARPRARVTAVDLYQGYYGIDDNTPDRLERNAQRAGVGHNVQVRVADMRQLPFDAGEFDAVMSVAAIDHLKWDGIEQTMRETARVLKPGGQFLIVSLNADGWVRVAMPWSLHGGFWGQSQNRERWRSALGQSGFDVADVGTRAATLYFLATKR